MKEQYISKSALVAELENLLDKGRYHEEYDCAYRDGNNGALYALKNKLDTLEVKEVDIASMADDYYNALMKEADWMDEGTIGHCRLAYYTGCKDVLNKIQKGE